MASDGSLHRWPLLRQLRAGDPPGPRPPTPSRPARRLPPPPCPPGLGRAARSRRSERLRPRTATADRVVPSVCPYCAVGCGQRVYVKDERIVQIEGDPDSPISRGRLCPKGSATKSLVTNPGRLTKVRYRAPHATEWQDLALDDAMDMIAD